MASQVKNPALADQGHRNIEWAERQMGALLKVKERFENEKPLAGVKVGLALHVTKETAVLVKTLVAGGAEVVITGCNPLSTQDDVAAALAEMDGVEVFAHKGETREEYYDFLNRVVKAKPDVTIDDGCDLVTVIHQEYPEMIPDLICGCEETTTGIIRLKAMEADGALKYPVFSVNDSNTKHLMDNFYGTGQSSLDGILRASNILFAGKIVVVVGYGSCGKGVASRARGLGAKVIVTEVDPFRALQATMDGFEVMPMVDAVKVGEVYITVTGNKHVISAEHIRAMKDGAILANSGHFDNEIDVNWLEKNNSGKRNIRPFFDEYTIGDKVVFLCGEGRLVNLAAAEGHPSTVMAMSFCNQALAVEYGVKNRDNLKPGVLNLPANIDSDIAALQLEAMEIRIDTLTDEQIKYLSSWNEGT
ncbi:MAG TPA: adenosylhomocysteinase [Firmicutes bacterium]|nr:adenosylhomocysteinase [Bacillota bacterium]